MPGTEVVQFIHSFGTAPQNASFGQEPVRITQFCRN